MRIGFGYDSHRFEEGRRLVLGGVEIPYDRGLLGHSDADVLLHAIGDAILGAIGEGDIGRHFPENDLTYKDISSRVILVRIKEMMKEKGFSIQNIDSTIVLEKPRLTKFTGAMVRTIAGDLEINEDSVNIKATTNEGMGFTGRSEGIAAFAVVMVKQNQK
ncbi:MAG: 2-C-methyl-D-erythritol 2,4-cyclodiphosphate synthase [Thermodesulfobacteriota bacterium]|nr:2-C-methyl-D-erythritol 2,4-cyclodiphosphate synthase [Thermodesulfobacteriota bacterium]